MQKSVFKGYFSIIVKVAIYYFLRIFFLSRTAKATNVDIYVDFFLGLPKAIIFRKAVKGRNL